MHLYTKLLITVTMVKIMMSNVLYALHV